MMIHGNNLAPQHFVNKIFLLSPFISMLCGTRHALNCGALDGPSDDSVAQPNGNSFNACNFNFLGVVGGMI